MSAADLLREVVPAGLQGFVSSFDDERVYVSPSAHSALATRDQFNLIDTRTGWKVDLIVRKDWPFSRSEFSRRRRSGVLGTDVYVATAEDTVLAKLEWAAMGGSERQLEDAATVLAVQGDDVDDEYLDRWAAELGVVGLLAEARARAQG